MKICKNPGENQFFYIRLDSYSSFTQFKRKALPITLTEENAIAAAANTGDGTKPNIG
ncbi:MAG: hypothetical protein R3E60_05415 [Alphaproteobacteria bacterium]